MSPDPTTLAAGFRGRRSAQIAEALAADNLTALTRDELCTVAARLGIYVPVRKGRAKIEELVRERLKP